MDNVFERLLQERCDLEIKIYHLDKFLFEHEDEYDRSIDDISDASYDLLKSQLSIMREYLEVLEKRIKLWKQGY